MKFRNFKRGFTLIELLVVIAIIGILSSVVLVSLNSARQKGVATRIQEDAANLRTTLETNSNGSAYTDLFCTTAQGAACVDAYSKMSANANSLITDVGTQGGGIQVYSSGCTANTANTCTAYSIEVSSPGTGITGFCVDSTGKTATGLTGTNKTFTLASASCPANNGAY